MAAGFVDIDDPYLLDEESTPKALAVEPGSEAADEGEDEEGSLLADLPETKEVAEQPEAGVASPESLHILHSHLQGPHALGLNLPSGLKTQRSSGIADASHVHS